MKQHLKKIVCLALAVLMVAGLAACGKDETPVSTDHTGKVLTYSAIIGSIWGRMDEGSVKKLQVNMANIRKKLGERPGDRRYISNELGVGYRMISDDE